jgi:peptidoglycan hydrolase-like protein with peptidoglycan-binding domain
MLFGTVLVSAAPAEAAGGYCSRAITYIGSGPNSVYLVPGDSNNNISCRLDQGANSSAVTALQRGLNGACAVSAGLTVDGSFGPATRAALIRAQQKFGVTADGVYGPNTAKAFRWTSSNGTCQKA